MTSACFDARALAHNASVCFSFTSIVQQTDADGQEVCVDFAHSYLRDPILFSAPEVINPVTPGHFGEHGVFLINNLLPPQMGCMREASRRTKRTAECPKTWHLFSVATVPILAFAHLLRSS